MLLNDKIMFDRYYCINEINNDTLYFIASSHFHTPKKFHFDARFGWSLDTHRCFV